MGVMTLSGWGQPHDALAGIAPGAVHVDYARLDVRDALKLIADEGRNHALVIGWSLGGQLAARAIAAGMFRPERLVLIAAPFQFVARPEDELGMKRDLYDKFRDNYARNPQRTLRKAWELVLKGDSRAEEMRQYIDAPLKEEGWLRWLDQLEAFSFTDIPLHDFPPTLLIHGDGDAVVEPAQSARFAAAIPQARHVVMEGTGHAPHWHDEAFVRRLIDV